MTSNPPPEEVRRAARVVQDWLDAQQRARLSQDAPRRLTDAEKLDRCRQFDQTKMPKWKDPRGA
jgi:hypothetical protein